MTSTRFLAFLFAALLLGTLGLVSCNGDDDDGLEDRIVILRITSPSKEAQYISGQEIQLNLDIKDDYPSAQLEIFANDSLILSQQGVQKTMEFKLDSRDWSLGFVNIKVNLTGAVDDLVSESRRVVIFSNSTPKILLPKIVETLAHKNDHYTQGLEFFEGRLFEGTGQFGESKLAEINLKNGAPLRILELEKTYFGEGITILNNEIYQLTWMNGVCFVYDLNTFGQKRQFTYSGEGWGLANDGTHLIMSDGSSKIVFRDPKTFDIVRSIQVFSDKQEYRAINELEYVDGFIYANVYQQDYILKINPKNGEVVALIDCEEIFRLGRGNGDVLNGIAFNKKNGLFYLTGKNWPKMFAVEFFEKASI
jgi:glutamine cyclotransferase